MDAIARSSGRCRFCGCGGDECRLMDGDLCCWYDAQRTVCSAPGCIRKYEAEIAETKRAAAAKKPKRLRSWEVNELIRRGRRRKKRKAA